MLLPSLFSLILAPLCRLSSGIASPMRHVRTRLYFTSHSHISSMFNLLQHGGLCKVIICIYICMSFSDICFTVCMDDMLLLNVEIFI